MSHRGRRIPVPLVATAGWVLPGAGYLLIGERARGLTVGLTIIGLFLAGLLIAGIRVLEVPGYDANGFKLLIPSRTQRAGGAPGGGWVLTSGGLVSEIANKPWYVPQLLAGPITLISSGFSIQAAQSGASRVHARLADIGTLYTAIAGMLNLLVIIDAAHRASRL